jgi:hypothetical protein
MEVIAVSQSYSVRFGGWMSMLGGALLVAAHSIGYAAGGVDTVLGKGIAFVAHILLAFSFIGIHEAQGKPSQKADLVGMTLGIVGTVLVGVIMFVEMLAANGAAVEQVLTSQPGSILQSISPLLFLAGTVFVGRAIMKNNILSRRGGRLLILGAMIFAIGSIAERDMSPYIIMLGAVFTGIGFMLIGYSMSVSRKL